MTSMCVSKDSDALAYARALDIKSNVNVDALSFIITLSRPQYVKVNMMVCALAYARALDRKSNVNVDALSLVREAPRV
jgi:hypothetical protein